MKEKKDFQLECYFCCSLPHHLSTSVCVYFIVVGNIQRSDNCSQMNLSGSSSSLASETSNKNSGQRSYGIGGAYLQKQIRMICQAGESSEKSAKVDREGESRKAEAEHEPTKIKGFWFRRLRERSSSRERAAFSAKREAEPTEALESSENQKDKDFDALSTASICSSRSVYTSYCLCRRPRRRRKTL